MRPVARGPHARHGHIPPAEHVRRRADFEQVYEGGAKVRWTLHDAVCGAQQRRDGATGRRRDTPLGGAVVRNRAKRLTRELFRHQKPAASLDVIVVPRREFLDAPYPVSKREFRCTSLSDPHVHRRGASGTPACPHGAALAAIRAYKVLLSPLFTGSCRFVPSCADYTSEAIARFGAARGIWLGTRRLGRCHPFGGHGLDPVPDQMVASQVTTATD